MIVAHILACIVLGALWRLLKGDTLRHLIPGGASWPGTAPIATWTLAPLCAGVVWPVLSPLDYYLLSGLGAGWYLAEWALLALLGIGLSALMLLVRADNGGRRPLLRFGLFGLGYWWADRYRPEWHAQLGEAWLGGTWFGACAWATWIIRGHLA